MAFTWNRWIGGITFIYMLEQWLLKDKGLG